MKKRAQKISTIDERFCGKKAIPISEFPALFESYLYEWMHVNFNVEERRLQGKTIIPYALYAEHVNIDERRVKQLTESVPTYIPSAVLKDMNLGQSKHEVEIKTIEVQEALVRLDA